MPPKATYAPPPRRLVDKAKLGLSILILSAPFLFCYIVQLITLFSVEPPFDSPIFWMITVFYEIMVGVCAVWWVWDNPKRNLFTQNRQS